MTLFAPISVTGLALQPSLKETSADQAEEALLQEAKALAEVSGVFGSRECPLPSPGTTWADNPFPSPTPPLHPGMGVGSRTYSGVFPLPLLLNCAGARSSGPGTPHPASLCAAARVLPGPTGTVL